MLSAEGARACLLWKGMLRFSAYKRILSFQSDSLKDEEGGTASSPSLCPVSKLTLCSGHVLSVLALQHLGST